jgi:hypothetical protein
MKRVAKLIGKKVILGPIYKKDIKLFHKWVNDIEVTQFLSTSHLQKRVLTRLIQLTGKLLWE